MSAGQTPSNRYDCHGVPAVAETGPSGGWQPRTIQPRIRARLPGDVWSRVHWWPQPHWIVMAAQRPSGSISCQESSCVEPQRRHWFSGVRFIWLYFLFTGAVSPSSFTEDIL
jgi:hypothetical protein